VPIITGDARPVTWLRAVRSNSRSTNTVDVFIVPTFCFAFSASADTQNQAKETYKKTHKTLYKSVMSMTVTAVQNIFYQRPHET
jgi:hypothetical protein